MTETNYNELREKRRLNISTEPSKTLYFKDLMLRDELARVIPDLGFEHPNAVQQQCIAKSLLGSDIICQAKSGTGKTAVYVISSLHTIKPLEKEISVMVLVPTREMAVQVKNEYLRFLKYFIKDGEIEIVADAFYGGNTMKSDCERLARGFPNIFIGTPGRVQDLIVQRFITLRHLTHIIFDECDKLISEINFRAAVQIIFYHTPIKKQVMMFSATLSPDVRKTCLKFLKDPFEIYVDGDRNLTLHGLTQKYVNIDPKMKKEKLELILDTMEFRQAVVFVRDKTFSERLTKYLNPRGFPTGAFHSGLTTRERLSRFENFKKMEYRILVTTDLMSRGIDVQAVDLVVNYDLPESAETYLHRVGRAGRYETKGVAVSIVSDEKDSALMNQIQSRFEVSIEEMSLSETN